MVREIGKHKLQDRFLGHCCKISQFISQLDRPSYVPIKRGL